MDHFGLKGKVAIVTGGSKGLGRAICIGLGRCGAKVAVLSRTKNLIEETANEVIKAGGDAMAIKTDVSDSTAIEKAVAEVVDQYGTIDILINNAGIAPMFSCVNTSIEEWDSVMNTNLKSLFVACRAVGPIMFEKKYGKVINIGSVLGQMVSNTAIAYCTSKAAVAQFTKALAAEWARYKINVNCISPGFFSTEMTEQQRNDEKHMKFLTGHIPFRRLGNPEEIVPPTLFLASDMASYITGSILIVDGGYVLM